MHLRVSALTALVAVTACAGNTAPVPNAQPQAAGATATPAAASASRSATVALRIAVPAAATATAARRRSFVSGGTNGLLVNVYTDPQSANPTPIASAVVDLSMSSGACSPPNSTTGIRSCTASFPAPPGTDDFAVTTYDTAPANGAIPTSAKVLGQATITSTVVLNATNPLQFAIGGEIATLALSGGTSYSFDSAQTRPITLSGIDASGATIIAGAQTANNGAQSETDTYANPITLSIAPSTHASLSLNGAAGSPSVTSTKSSDTVTLQYDGAAYASPATLVVSAAASGATTQTTAFVPLVVSSTSSYVAATTGTTKVAFLAAGQTATLTTSGGTGGSYTYAPQNANSTACPTNAVAFGLALGSPSISLTAASAATDCRFTVTDGVSTDTIDVSVTTSGSTIVVPTKTLVAAGSNGSGIAAQTTYALPTGTVASTLTVEPIAIPANSGGNSYTGGVARDASGATYLTVNTEYASAQGNIYDATQIVAYAAGASGTAQPTQQQTIMGSPHNVAVDRSGKVYVAYGGSLGFAVYPAGLTGPPITTVAGSNTRLLDSQGIAVDAAGNVYILQKQFESNAYHAGEIDVFAPPASGAQNVAPTRVITIAAPIEKVDDPQGISMAVDLAGDVFVTQRAGNLLRFNAGNTSNVPDMQFPIESTAVAVDSTTNALYVSALGSPYPIYVYDANDPTVTPTTLVPSQPTQASQLAL